MKQLIDVAKKALAATNPGIRAAGVELAGVLYFFMGPKLRTFFEGEKGPILQTLDSEFRKYEGLKPPQPTRKWKLAKPTSNGLPASNGPAELEEEEEDADEVEADLMPRKDIRQVTYIIMVVS